MEPRLTIEPGGQIEAHKLRTHAAKGKEACAEVYLAEVSAPRSFYEAGVKRRRTDMVHLHGRLLVTTCHSNHNVVKYSHLHCYKRYEISKKCGCWNTHVDAIDYVNKLHEYHFSEDSILTLHWK